MTNVYKIILLKSCLEMKIVDNFQQQGVDFKIIYSVACTEIKTGNKY